MKIPADVQKKMWAFFLERTVPESLKEKLEAESKESEKTERKE